MNDQNAQPASKNPARPKGAAMAWHEEYALQLDSQLTLLSKLEALSQQQRELISLEDPEPLLQLVQERQIIVDELVEIDTQTQDLRAKVMLDGPATLDRPLREGLKFKLEQIAARAKSVMQRDAKDQELMQARRKKLSQELTELTGAKRAVAAYGQSGSGKGPVFQDQEG